jgi:hypothetical protein
MKQRTALIWKIPVLRANLKNISGRKDLSEI